MKLGLCVSVMSFVSQTHSVNTAAKCKNDDGIVAARFLSPSTQYAQNIIKFSWNLSSQSRIVGEKRFFTEGGG